MKNFTLFLLGLVLINVPACLSTSTSSNQCFSLALGYPCCTGNTVVYSDGDGDWGVENNNWCGISYPESCFAEAYGYPCCETCVVKYSDESGRQWGKENKQWCGIKDSCNSVGSLDDAEFNFAFLKLENNKKNMIYSPLSIKYALNMLKEGADYNTYIEIDKVIGNTKLYNYTNIENNLSFANGIFVRDKYYNNVKTEYINTLEEKYGAEVIQDSFQSAENANRWIEEKTMGKIKDVLDDNKINNINCKMILMNALAIDMEWSKKFPGCTKSNFYFNNGSRMETLMMRIKGTYSEDIAFFMSASAIALKFRLQNYNNLQLEFLAIMPSEDLSSYVENFSKEQLDLIDKNFTYASETKSGVDVGIPKFKFNYELDFINDLMELGINDAFDDSKSDFSKMTRKNELYVSDAIHKADIDFSEEGIKAAAVTVFTMYTKAISASSSYPISVVIDRPFMFIIRDRETEDIWFTGTVYEPLSWDQSE